MMKKENYTDYQLVRHLMRDLISDLASGGKVKHQIIALWKNRHSVTFDKYGWPNLPEFN